MSGGVSECECEMVCISVGICVCVTSMGEVEMSEGVDGGSGGADFSLTFMYVS